MTLAADGAAYRIARTGAPDEARAHARRLAVLKGEEPLRLLMPSYRSDPHTGGQGIYMKLMTKALVDLGHQIDVVSGPPYAELDPRVRQIKLRSLDLYTKPKNWLGVPDYPKVEGRDWIDFKEYVDHVTGKFGEPESFGERLARYMQGRAHDYDAVHDNQTLCWGLLKIQRMGIPVAGTIHHPITRDRSIAVAHAKGFKLKLLIRRWYSFLPMQIKVARQLDPVIVVSEATKRDVVKEFGVAYERMRTVLHGINATDFHPERHIARKPNLLVTVASADVALKGLIYLIRAYAKLLARYPDLELVVVSKLREGNTSRELDALGLKDRVKFVSGLSIEALRRLYAEATIAVSPSVYEGFGFPCGEAMACATPVVATNGGALPEVVGEAGVVVPHSDPEALAAGIAGLLDDPARRVAFGEAAYQRIQDRFLWSRAAADAVAVYKEAIAKHYRLTEFL